MQPLERIELQRKTLSIVRTDLFSHQRTCTHTHTHTHAHTHTHTHTRETQHRARHVSGGEIHCLCDANPVMLKERAEEFGIPPERCYSSVADMLDKEVGCPSARSLCMLHDEHCLHAQTHFDFRCQAERQESVLIDFRLSPYQHTSEVQRQQCATVPLTRKQLRAWQDLDFCDIVTQPASHKAIVMQICAHPRRKVHIICQKPMAPSLEVGHTPRTRKCFACIYQKYPFVNAATHLVHASAATHTHTHTHAHTISSAFSYRRPARWWMHVVPPGFCL